jgi:hypothetical protein
VCGGGWTRSGGLSPIGLSSEVFRISFAGHPGYAQLLPRERPSFGQVQLQVPQGIILLLFFTSENCEIAFSGSMSPSQLSTHLNFNVPSNMDMYDRLLATRHVS